MTPLEIRAALRDIDLRHRRGEAEQAREDYAKRARVNPTLEARFLAAAAISDDEASWEALRDIAQEQPDFYWAHAGIAAIYGRWTVRDQCERTLVLAASLRPDLAYTHTLRGLMHMNLSEYEAAVESFDRALAMDPTDADARVARALSRRALDDDSSFQAELERALRDWPSHYLAAVDLALWIDAKGDPAALAAWERVAKLAPRHRHARIALARLRGHTDVAGSILALEEAAHISPLEPSELTQLVGLYRRAGRADDEIPALRRLIGLTPNEASHRLRLAELLEQQGDAEAAEPAYRAVLELDAQNGAAHLGLGRLLERSARIREALSSYRAAREAGEPRASAEEKRLAEACLLPSKPLRARSLNHLYASVSDSLDRLYQRRLRDAPMLKGTVRARLQANARGGIVDVEITGNTLNDPWLEAHLHFLLRDAAWTRADGDPQRFTLSFDLPPVKQ